MSSILASPLRRDARGVTVVEFALVLPVFLLLVIGAMDVGHTLYMRAMLQGAMQKASRDSGLETGATSATDAAIDASVKDQVIQIANNATVTFQRNYFRSFTQAVDVREPFTDSTTAPWNDNICNHGEPFVDENNNGVWDTNGVSGQGGAKDTVVYTATVTYPRLFPMAGLIGLPANVTVKATTVMNNQPYGDQGSDGAPIVRSCP